MFIWRHATKRGFDRIHDNPRVGQEPVTTSDEGFKRFHAARQSCSVQVSPHLISRRGCVCVCVCVTSLPIDVLLLLALVTCYSM